MVEVAVEAAVLLRMKGGAAFVQDVLRDRSLGASASELEHVLDNLVRRGRVLVRPHSAGDPHLEGVDLRIMAAVPTDGSGSLSSAVEAIEKAWQVWLADFLSSHRCT